MKDHRTAIALIRAGGRDISAIDIYNRLPDDPAGNEAMDETPSGFLNAISMLRKADAAFLDEVMKFLAPKN